MDMKTDRKGQTGTDTWTTLVAPVAPLAHALDIPSAAPATILPGVPVTPVKLLLTVRDCASMTSLSEKTILRIIQRGKLRALSSIRHKRIPASELARFIRDNLT
jgi:excisionase family DNA binding protein